jgi:hypothetical protein
VSALQEFGVGVRPAGQTQGRFRRTFSRGDCQYSARADGVLIRTPRKSRGVTLAPKPADDAIEAQP